MKILYIQNVRLPSQKAHGLQIMQTCSALSALGHEVTLAINADGSAEESTIFDHYQLPKNFSIKKIPSITILSFGAVGFVLSLHIFAWNARRLLKYSEYDAVYTRDDILVNKGFFYEMHDVRRGYFQRRALRRAGGVITITHGLADYCRSTGVDDRRIAISPDGVDLKSFDVTEDKEMCRAKLGLPSDKKIVLYSGHLYSWKGAHVLAEAASTLPKDTLVVFVGGHDRDIDDFKARFGTKNNIMITGRQPHSIIPYYLKSADILVLPNSAKQDISRLYTSPLKLFEYMSSGTPIIASDLPSLREILNENNAVFFKPDDAVSLVQAIHSALNDTKIMQEKSCRALQDIKNYTWENRARTIADFINRSVL